MACSEKPGGSSNRRVQGNTSHEPLGHRPEPVIYNHARNTGYRHGFFLNSSSWNTELGKIFRAWAEILLVKERFQVSSKCAERRQWPFLFAVFLFCSLHCRDPDFRGSDGLRLCWRGNKWACPTSRVSSNLRAAPEPGPCAMCVDQRPQVVARGRCNDGFKASKKAEGIWIRAHSVCISALSDIREDLKEISASKLKDLIPQPGEAKRTNSFSIVLMHWSFWEERQIQEAELSRAVGLQRYWENSTKQSGSSKPNKNKTQNTWWYKQSF